ncbi:MAG: radical SAM protein [Candidatus Omnitrophica bacterium]|nr:radical SAM protein [Candidatus Omnitrophota bacterium]
MVPGNEGGQVKKKFVFVNLSINCGYNSGMNHGIAFLVPIVRRFGYDVVCLNIRKEIKPAAFLSMVKNADPSIVAFSCTSHQLKYLAKYSNSLAGSPGILQIAGGVGATLDNEWILRNTRVKGACIGEGDIPLEELLRNLQENKDYRDTQGFSWNVNGTIKKNPVPQFKNSFSEADLPDHSIFDKDVILSSNGTSIMLSRGCPYNCYYCCNAALSGVYPSPAGYFRTYSVDFSIRLIQNMIAKHPETNFIHFEDDLLIANKEWFLDFAREYAAKIGLPYRVCARVECVTKEIVGVLKESGCRLVFVGLESGDEPFRSRMLNRKYTNELFIEKCAIIKDAGLKLFTFNIVGFPEETAKEMANTFELNKSVVPHSGVCTFFYPYKYTQLHTICKERGLLKEDSQLVEITNYNTRPAIAMTASQEKECVHYQRKILNYLLRQNELTEIAELPSGLQKCNKAMRHWVKAFLRKSPLLDRAIRGTYANIKLKAARIICLSD